MGINIFETPEYLPGIALHQPYAGLVRLGIKSIETRMMRCNHRGSVVICATRTTRPDVLQNQRSEIVPNRVLAVDYDTATGWLGCVVALANLVDCRLLTRDDEPRARFWSDADAGKRYAWILEDIRPVIPRAVRCMPGWFPVARSIVEVQP